MKNNPYCLKQGFWMAMLILLGSGAVRAQKNDTGRIYQFDVAKKGRMIADATCFAWIPDDVKVLRSVIVHLHGCTREGDASQMMYDIQWKALARKWHSVLLAPKFISGGNAQRCVNWYNPDNGSDSVFMAMLDTLAERSGHPEIRTIPWALWGHSGGSIWTTVMTGKYPRRVAVAVAESCGMDISGNKEALAVPILYHNGRLDICNNGTALFSGGRGKGAFWAHAVNPVVASPMDGHQVHNLRFLAIPWIDACLALRLPDKPGGSALRPLTRVGAWLGDTATKAIASQSDFRGDKLAACWFPNRLLAEKWAQYMKTGTVVDATPPPAPYDLSATYGHHGISIRWKCAPDLESGIQTFVIYRDGKKLQTLHYSTKTKYSDETGFQRWNDGDQPSPVPPPEMIFTDTGASAQSRTVYQVSCVNWSHLEGQKSAQLVLKGEKSR